MWLICKARQLTPGRMEGKVLLSDGGKVIMHADRRDDRKKTGASSPSATSCSCSSRASKCCDKATEYLCSACLLCVCCPLALVWGCFKVPCRLGWHAAKRARRRACCGSEMKDFAAYSSFSDSDSGSLPRGKHACPKTPAGSIKMVTKGAN